MPSHTASIGLVTILAAALKGADLSNGKMAWTQPAWLK